MKTGVAVALSGGVDSAVAAALLKKQGYEVIGVSLRLLPRQGFGRNFQSNRQEQAAEEVARHLCIRHEVFDLSRVFNKCVIENFCAEYLKGNTPNPCLICNQKIKFGILLNKLKWLNADFMATGHYARIVHTRAGYQLKKARDKTKDQSYFLYRLGQEQLKNIVFPLGGYTKAEVRKLAVRFKLPSAGRPDSQDICFLPDSDYRAFLRRQYPARLIPGPIKDERGRIVGRHQGIGLYTIGQRQGLGVCLGYPAYVTSIDPSANELHVGSKSRAYQREFIISPLNYVLKPFKNKVVLKIRVRYNQKEQPADIYPLSRNLLKAVFHRPQFSLTRGQSAVFYQGNTVVGGGVIKEVIC